MDRPANPAILVIFGITGDLSQRKLLPALYHLFKDDLLDERTVILGITRRDVTAEELLNNVELCVNEIDKVCDPTALNKVHRALRMFKMSQIDPAEYRQLLELMNSFEAEKGVCMHRLYYLSIPPQMFSTIVRNLGEQGLNKSCQHGTADSRLLVEKPFGYDLASARQLITETGEWFSEEQLFRIDHYLAKDTVQHILDFRSGNPAVEPIWNNSHISRIAITAFEKIDIEGRAAFYEGVGALRDFAQNHLLQLLAITAMELPENNSSDAVHQSRLKLFQDIEPVATDEVDAMAIRGQYEGYRAEVGNPHSVTETYIHLRLRLTNERWKNTMVTLETGKAMGAKSTRISVFFGEHGKHGYLRFHIQPDKGVTMSTSRQPLEAVEQLRPYIVKFNAAHPPSPTDHPDAYERVLLDAVCGDHTLFTTSREILRAWEIVNNVVTAWSASDKNLRFYPKGSESLLPAEE